MTVAGADIKMIYLVFKDFFDCIEQNGRVFRGNLIGTVIKNRPLLIGDILLRECYNVAAQRYIGCFHIDADAESFERGTPRIIFFRIIAQNCEIGRITARFHSIRNCGCKSYLRERCQAIHCRSIRIFDRCFSSQFLNWLICHTVAKHDYVFHSVILQIFIDCLLLISALYSTLSFYKMQPSVCGVQAAVTPQVTVHTAVSREVFLCIAKRVKLKTEQVPSKESKKQDSRM